MISGVIALEFDRLADEYDRVLVAPLVMGDNAEIVQRLRVAGLDGEDLLVKRRGFRQPAGLVLRDGLRRRFAAGLGRLLSGELPAAEVQSS